MDIEGRRRSSNFEDRGRGGGGGGGGLPLGALLNVAQMLGVKGVAVLGAVLGIGYFVLPSGLKAQLFGTLSGGSGGAAPGSGSVCASSAENGKACDFSRVILASTEDVWSEKFQRNELPRYSEAPADYQQPTLVVFTEGVATGGCGTASSAVGPFYCPADRKLYIDPGFYDVMERRMKAPGDFAQAYVIAHEVGHHVQHLIGATRVRVGGESKNQTSVRVELQADCFAGVWGHSARATLAITEADLKEAVTAAHAIGDDTLGHSDADDYTHGTSAQRIRWFRRGFEGGDPRQCDPFAIEDATKL